MPTISVIVPVYKVEPYIRRCVDSILAQTYRDFELILVDDGSPDSCGMICDEYAEQDSRIHVIHQKNGGLSAARNAGIDWAFANSDSQWLTFVDSDDWVHQQMLERLMHAAKTNQVNVSICGYALTTGDTPEALPVESVCWKPEEFYTAHNTNAVVAWGKLYKKTCFETIRYPVGKINEDEFVTYRILFVEKDIAFTSMPMYFYFQNTSGITKSIWSPKRLDKVEALRAQTFYFKENGYSKAYQMMAGELAGFIARQMKLVEQSELPREKKREYSHYLRKNIRMAIVRFQEMYDFHQVKWVYHTAWPKTMALYYHGVLLFQKIKNIFKE